MEIPDGGLTAPVWFANSNSVPVVEIIILTVYLEEMGRFIMEMKRGRVKPGNKFYLAYGSN